MAYARFVLGLLMSGVIFIGGSIWLIPDIDLNFKHALAGDLTALNTLFLFLAMLAGSVAKAFHAEVEKPITRAKAKNPSRKSSVARRALTSKSLLLSLIVSPISFLVVYKVAGQEPDRIVALLLSFQNGFFWKTIFENARTGDE